MYCILYGGMYLPTYKGCERTFGETGKLCIYSPSSYLCLKKVRKKLLAKEKIPHSSTSFIPTYFPNCSPSF